MITDHSGFNDSKLGILLQPTAEGKWLWAVGYPHGSTYESGEMDTLENAAAVAKVALRLLETKR